MPDWSLAAVGWQACVLVSSSTMWPPSTSTPSSSAMTPRRWWVRVFPWSTSSGSCMLPAWLPALAGVWSFISLSTACHSALACRTAAEGHGGASERLRVLHDEGRAVQRRVRAAVRRPGEWHNTRSRRHGSSKGRGFKNLMHGYLRECLFLHGVEEHSTLR